MRNIQEYQRDYAQKRKITHTSLTITKELRDVIKHKSFILNMTIEEYLCKLVTLCHNDLAVILKLIDKKVDSKSLV